MADAKAVLSNVDRLALYAGVLGVSEAMPEKVTSDSAFIKKVGAEYTELQEAYNNYGEKVAKFIEGQKKTDLKDATPDEQKLFEQKTVARADAMLATTVMKVIAYNDSQAAADKPTVALSEVISGKIDDKTKQAISENYEKLSVVDQRKYAIIAQGVTRDLTTDSLADIDPKDKIEPTLIKQIEAGKVSLEGGGATYDQAKGKLDQGLTNQINQSVQVVAVFGGAYGQAAPGGVMTQDFLDKTVERYSADQEKYLAQVEKNMAEDGSDKTWKDAKKAELEEKYGNATVAQIKATVDHEFGQYKLLQAAKLMHQDLAAKMAYNEGIGSKDERVEKKDTPAEQIAEGKEYLAALQKANPKYFEQINGAAAGVIRGFSASMDNLESTFANGKTWPIPGVKQPADVKPNPEAKADAQQPNQDVEYETVKRVVDKRVERELDPEVIKLNTTAQNIIKQTIDNVNGEQLALDSFGIKGKLPQFEEKIDGRWNEQELDVLNNVVGVLAKKLGIENTGEYTPELGKKIEEGVSKLSIKERGKLELFVIGGKDRKALIETLNELHKRGELRKDFEMVPTEIIEKVPKKKADPEPGKGADKTTPDANKGEKKTDPEPGKGADKTTPDANKGEKKTDPEPGKGADKTTPDANKGGKKTEPESEPDKGDTKITQKDIDKATFVIEDLLHSIGNNVEDIPGAELLDMFGDVKDTVLPKLEENEIGGKFGPKSQELAAKLIMTLKTAAGYKDANGYYDQTVGEGLKFQIMMNPNLQFVRDNMMPEGQEAPPCMGLDPQSGQPLDPKSAEYAKQKELYGMIQKHVTTKPLEEPEDKSDKAAMAAYDQDKKMREYLEKNHQAEIAGVKRANEVFDKMNILHQKDLLMKKDEARQVNQNNIMMDVAAGFLDSFPGLKNMLKDFFTNSPIGKMLATLLGSVKGIDVSRLWGEKTDYSDEKAVAQQKGQDFDDLYIKARETLEQEKGEDAELTNKEIMEKAKELANDDMNGKVFKFAMKFVDGDNKGFTQNAVNRAMDAAAAAGSYKDAREAFIQSLEQTLIEKDHNFDDLKQKSNSVEQEVKEGAKDLGVKQQTPAPSPADLAAASLNSGVNAGVEDAALLEIQNGFKVVYDLAAKGLGEGASHEDIMAEVKELVGIGEGEKSSYERFLEGVEIYQGTVKSALDSTKGSTDLTTASKAFVETAGKVFEEKVGMSPEDLQKEVNALNSAMGGALTNALELIDIEDKAKFLEFVQKDFEERYGKAAKELGKDAKHEDIMGKVKASYDVENKMLNDPQSRDMLKQMFDGADAAMNAAAESAMKGADKDAAAEEFAKSYKDGMIGLLKGVKTDAPILKTMTSQTIGAEFKKDTRDFDEKPMRTADGRVEGWAAVLLKPENAAALGIEMDLELVKVDGEAPKVATRELVGLTEEVVYRAIIHDWKSQGKEITEKDLADLKEEFKIGTGAMLAKHIDKVEKFMQDNTEEGMKARLKEAGVGDGAIKEALKNQPTFNAADIAVFTQGIGVLSKDMYSNPDEPKVPQKTSVLDQAFSLHGQQAFDINDVVLSDKIAFLKGLQSGTPEEILDKADCNLPVFYMKEGSDSVFVAFKDEANPKGVELEFDYYQSLNSINLNDADDKSDVERLLKNFKFGQQEGEPLSVSAKRVETAINEILKLKDPEAGLNIKEEKKPDVDEKPKEDARQMVERLTGGHDYHNLSNRPPECFTDYPKLSPKLQGELEYVLQLEGKASVLDSTQTDKKNLLDAYFDKKVEAGPHGIGGFQPFGTGQQTGIVLLELNRHGVRHDSADVIMGIRNGRGEWDFRIVDYDKHNVVDQEVRYRAGVDKDIHRITNPTNEEARPLEQTLYNYHIGPGGVTTPMPFGKAGLVSMASINPQGRLVSAYEGTYGTLAGKETYLEHSKANFNLRGAWLTRTKGGMVNRDDAWTEKEYIKVTNRFSREEGINHRPDYHDRSTPYNGHHNGSHYDAKGGVHHHEPGCKASFDKASGHHWASKTDGPWAESKIFGRTGKQVGAVGMQSPFSANSVFRLKWKHGPNIGAAVKEIEREQQMKQQMDDCGCKRRDDQDAYDQHMQNKQDNQYDPHTDPNMLGGH